MKKHSLNEHWEDVQGWWLHSRKYIRGPGQDEDRILFIAYERWLNDRPLLSEEDQTRPSRLTEDEQQAVRDEWEKKLR